MTKTQAAIKAFFDLKAKHPDTITFFKIGDFFEAFYEDAQILSSTCGVTLTGRTIDEKLVPLAGVPYHCIDKYLIKLLQAGYRVSVCEQTEPGQDMEPKRDIVRLVDGATIYEKAE